MPMQRVLACVAVLIGLMVGLSDAHAQATGTQTERNVLRWSSQGDALTFDPHAQNETPTIAALLQVYEPLVRWNPDLEIIPALATSWRTLDPTTWEFKIRQDVRFHDGTPLTVEDIKFSIERAQTENSDFSTYVEPVKEVVIIDAETIHLITYAPTPLLLENLTTTFMMSQAWAEANDVVRVQKRARGEENYAVRNANGTGAFKLDLREPDVRTIMSRNDDWWGLSESPHNIDEIRFRPIANDATRVAALLSGELDFIIDPPLQDLQRIDRTRGLRLKAAPQLRTIFLGLNQGTPTLTSSSVTDRNPFADRRVRQAVYQAINADAIQRAIMRGQSVPAGVIIQPGINGYTPELDTRLEHDTNAARQLLEDAGYPDGFDVTLDCPNDRYVNDEAICQAVVGMLARAGIRVTLDALPKSLHFPKIENRTTDFYLLGWNAATVDSEYVFSYLYRSQGTWNAANYANARVDDLIDAMGEEIDRDARNALIAETWAIVTDDIVYVPLHHQVINWALTDDFDMPIVVDNQPRFFWGRFE